MSKKEESQGSEVQIISGDNMEVMSRTEIDIQIKTAKEYPRDLKIVRREVVDLATMSKEIAEGCFYELPARQGQDPITGPSIRLAEIMTMCWGNSMSGSRVLEVGQRQVRAQGFFFDLEKNTRVYKEATRSIINKDGRRYPEHLINTTTMAALAVAHRNAIFGSIPMIFFTDVENRLKDVALGNIKDLETSRNEALDTFYKDYDASKEEICAYLHVKSVDDIMKDELWRLKKLQTAFKDKQAKPDEIFKRAERKEQSSASQKAYGNQKKPGQPKQTTIDGK